MTIPDSLALIGIIIATFMSYLAWKSAKDVAAAQLFLDLRKSYEEVLGDLPAEVHMPDWDPRDTKDADAAAERRKGESLQKVQAYWTIAFTEWFATQELRSAKGKIPLLTKRKGSFSFLWEGFYRGAIAGGLRNEPLRRVLCEMLYGYPGSTFSGYRETFAKAIDSLYTQRYNEPLREGVEVKCAVMAKLTFDPPNYESWWNTGSGDVDGNVIALGKTISAKITAQFFSHDKERLDPRINATDFRLQLLGEGVKVIQLQPNVPDEIAAMLVLGRPGTTRISVALQHVPTEYTLYGPSRAITIEAAHS